MKITLDRRNPTPAHCDVAVFVNGALAGVLKLRLEEWEPFKAAVGCEDLRERVDELETLLRELQNARPLLLYGDAWIERIKQVLEA